MRRHAYLAVALALAVAVALAGCGGTGGDGTPRPPLSGTASAAELTPEVRDATGFSERGRVTDRLNTTISATVQGDVELRTTRRANVTTVSVAYERPREEGPPAAFGTYSVPSVRPFERADLTKNPAAGLSSAELATRAQRTYEIRGTSETGTATVTLLGNETRATRYTATATVDGEEVPVVVTAATVRHEGDHVTAVVVAPAAGRDPPTATLFGGVTH